MLEIRNELHSQRTMVSLDNEQMSEKTQAYLIEVITQKMADIFIGKHGEKILANLVLDPDIKEILKAKIITQLHEASERVLRRAEDNASLRGEDSRDQEDPHKRTGGDRSADFFTGL